MNVLVDSNYFYALLNPEDSNHKKALFVSQKLQDDEVNLFVNEYVALESLTIISQSLSKRLSLYFGESLIKGEGVSLIHVNEKIFIRTWEIFKKIPNKDMSFVDCSLIATMQEEPIVSLLTFDITDFKKLQIPYHFKLYYSE